MKVSNSRFAVQMMGAYDSSFSVNVYIPNLADASDQSCLHVLHIVDAEQKTSACKEIRQKVHKFYQTKYPASYGDGSPFTYIHPLLGSTKAPMPGTDGYILDTAVDYNMGLKCPPATREDRSSSNTRHRSGYIEKSLLNPVRFIWCHHNPYYNGPTHQSAQ
jgi:hypothetical protein